VLYLKPHLNTEAARAFVKTTLVGLRVKVYGEGRVSGADLCAAFDNQYSEMMKKATVLHPSECSLASTDMVLFEKKFKMSWRVAVRKELVQNCASVCKKLDLSPDALGKAWMRCVGEGKVVKLGRGFYCGLIDSLPDKPAVFCINGFFMAMRAEYLAEAASVHYFLVEWDEAVMSWAEFRKKVVGATNPAFAHPESLRSVLSSRWEELGVDGPLDMMRNGVHASASAFEAMVERSIWLKVPMEQDVFGAEVLEAGATPSQLSDWKLNVSVNGKPVFGLMAGLGSRGCLEVVRGLTLSSGDDCKFWRHCNH